MIDRDSALFLPAVVVPPACFLLLVLYSIWFLRAIRRARSTPPVRPASVSYPTASLPQLASVAHRPSQSSPFPLATTSPSAEYLPHRRAPLPPFDTPYSPPTPLSLPQTASPPVFSPPPPPIPPSPADSRFNVTISRTGSRVLARNASSNNSHGTHSSGSEKRRSRPEKTKRVKKQYGIGEADDVEFDDDRVHDDTVIVNIVSGAGEGLRQRTQTWSAGELEEVVRRASYGSQSAPNSAVTPSLRPLPPGASYGDLTPSPEEGVRTSDEGFAAGGSSDSDGALLRQQRSAREDDEEEVLEQSATWTEGRRVVVRDLRELRGRPGHPVESTPPLNKRFSDGSSFYANPHDDVTISAASDSNHWMSTSIVPLPPPSPSSVGHSPVDFVCDWSTSSHSHDTTVDPRHLSRGSSAGREKPLHPFQSTPPALYPSRGTPPLLNNPRTSQASAMSLSTTNAIEDLEHYAASLSSSVQSFTPTHLLSTPHPPCRSPSPSATLSREHSRRQDSAPWFAGAAPPPAPVFEPVEELNSSQEKEQEFQKARRPISWVRRQASNGTLPDGVAAVGNFTVANPDEHSLRTSTSSGYMSPT
ncbi:hypothetical protein JCM8547_005962 [Rhodosporidiobolus lusitaniae]